MHTTHTLRTFLKMAKRPLLALSLVLLLGTGVASAYDTCSSCVKPVRVVRSYPVVYRSAPVVRRAYYRPLYYAVPVCNPCAPVVVCDPCY